MKQKLDRVARSHRQWLDHNAGACALKNFLHYAESLSRGDAPLARQILDGLPPLKRRSLGPAQRGGIPADQLCAALRARGWKAEPQVGQSRFRCDVAVRAAGSSRHQLAILMDATGEAGVLERFHTQPAIWTAFGWEVLIILTKDWWHEPMAVIERILRGETEAERATREMNKLIAEKVKKGYAEIWS